MEDIIETTEKLKARLEANGEKFDLVKNGRIFVNGKVIKEGYEELREHCEEMEASLKPTKDKEE